MRGRFLFLMMLSMFFAACEDPTTLPVSNTFGSNKLQTAYSDTFSVVTSVVQLDTFLTSGTGAVLLGKYKDAELGTVSSSPYFQICYNSQFLPDKRFFFDSVALIMPYTHVFTGDTTNAVKFNAYQLSEQMQVRTLPNSGDLKLSVYNGGIGFFNCSVIKHKPVPFFSATVNFRPHDDSLFVRLPDSIGTNWFNLAQQDSGKVFSVPSNFVNNYFYGLYMETDPSTNACVATFKANGVKIRLYYRALIGDQLQEIHADFALTNGSYQFNHIEYDRTGTSIQNLGKLQSIPTKFTNNLGFVQTGTGLVTRLDFPSLKSFFTLTNGVILNAAFLDIYPQKGSYPHDFIPPTALQLFTTDASNIPLGTITGGSAAIVYDYQYQLNTYYQYQLYSYILGQIHSGTNYFTSLIIGPSGSQGNSVQRVYLGDRFYPETRIRLKIYYSYALN